MFHSIYRKTLPTLFFLAWNRMQITPLFVWSHHVILIEMCFIWLTITEFSQEILPNAFKYFKWWKKVHFGLTPPFYMMIKMKERLTKHFQFSVSRKMFRFPSFRIRFSIIWNDERFEEERQIPNAHCQNTKSSKHHSNSYEFQ